MTGVSIDRRSARLIAVLIALIVCVGAVFEWTGLSLVEKSVVAFALLAVLSMVREAWWNRMDALDEELVVRDLLWRVRRIPYRDVRKIVYLRGSAIRLETDGGEVVHFKPNVPRAEEFISEVATRVARRRSVDLGGDVEIDEP